MLHEDKHDIYQSYTKLIPKFESTTVGFPGNVPVIINAGRRGFSAKINSLNGPITYLFDGTGIEQDLTEV